MKTCVLCKHIYMESGSPDYSEYTPGEDAMIYCQRGKWRVNLYRDYTETYREKLLSAETCELFEEYDEGP